jgi:DDE family transposase
MRDNGRGAFVQGYNAQAAVDAAAQVIVAAEVTQDVVDRNQLVPMCTRMQQELGELPAVITADAGYWNTVEIEAVSRRGVEVLVAPDATHEWAAPRTGNVSESVQRMREKLRGGPAKTLYGLRRCTVEPVFGQIKSARRLDRFSFRGLEKVKAEWQMFCLTHNLLKLYRARIAPLPCWSGICIAGPVQQSRFSSQVLGTSRSRSDMFFPTGSWSGALRTRCRWPNDFGSGGVDRQPHADFLLQDLENREKVGGAGIASRSERAMQALARLLKVSGQLLKTDRCIDDVTQYRFAGRSSAVIDGISKPTEN